MYGRGFQSRPDERETVFFVVDDMVIVSCCDEFFVPLILKWTGLTTGPLKLNNKWAATGHEEYPILPTGRP